MTRRKIGLSWKDLLGGKTEVVGRGRVGLITRDRNSGEMKFNGSLVEMFRCDYYTEQCY